MIARRTFLLTALALAAAERKLNLLLLVAGQWRAQATPWAGDPDLVAPNLEKFGKQSVVFSRAYSCYPRSTPARAALLTGRFPHTTGVIRDGTPLPSSEVALDAVLRSAGYRVGSRPSSMAIEFLERSPFFLNVSLEEAPRVSKPYDAASLHPRVNVPSEAEPKARQNLANRYGLYSALDDTIGGLMAALSRLGLADDTIVVFTSEHGEQIGSLGLDGDDVAFEESVRIPLAIHVPGAQPAASDVLISQADLMPTLLTLCGEPAPEGVQGHDLSGLLAGKKSERPESVYAEGKIGQNDEWRMLVAGFDKLVVNSRTEITNLYNLADDPYELTNLAHDPALQLKRDGLLAALRASMRRLGDFKRRP